MVVSNIFHFHPYLGKIPILTNIFQRGWNHQLEDVFPIEHDMGIFQSAMLVYKRVWVNSTKKTKKRDVFCTCHGIDTELSERKKTAYLEYAGYKGQNRTIYIYYSVIYGDSNKPWNKNSRLFNQPGFHRVRWNFQLFSAHKKTSSFVKEAPRVFGRPLKRTLAEETHCVNGNWETGYLVYSWVVPGTPNNRFFFE